MVRHTNFVLLWRGALRLVLLVALSGATECVVMGGYTFEGYHAPGIGGSAGSRSADGGCIPLTCEDLHAECGMVPDGCDSVLNCGTCEVGSCGGAGRNKCGLDPCTTRSCTDLGASCGQVSDGCGDTVQC